MPNIQHTTSDTQSIYQHGFTLVEMLVVLAIFAIITTVVLTKQSQFNNGILLSNLAYDIGLSVREAQVYGLGVREGDIGTEQFSGGYGVAFERNLTTQYELFWDSDDDMKYWMQNNDGTAVKTYDLSKGHIIEDVCVYDKIMGSSADPGCFSLGTASNYNIIFKRPDPEALILSGNGVNQYERMEITLKAPDGTRRIVKVNRSGQIAVE